MSKRVYGLDILRATAIILVIVYHANKIFYNQIKYKYFLAIPDGVTIFFVLSGFLIGGILLRMIDTGATSFSDLKIFWYRRWLRTLPAYFVILTLLILHRYWQKNPIPPSEYFPFYFFCQNILSGRLPFFSESWSLSIEEWFYILLPFLIFVSMRFFRTGGARLILFWALSFILLFHIIRFIRIYYHDVYTYGAWNNLIRKSVMTRLDGIAVGVVGSWASFNKVRLWQRKKMLFIAGIIFLLLPSVYYLIADYNQAIGFLRITSESIGALLVIPLLASKNSGTKAGIKWMTKVSVLSYSIYLVHYTGFYEWILPRINIYTSLSQNSTTGAAVFRFACYLLWAFVAAWLLNKFVEKPFMERRDRWYRIN